jgi:chromosome segregation ATPase
MSSSKKQLEELQSKYAPLEEEAKQLKRELKQKTEQFDKLERDNKLVHARLLETVTLAENWKKKANEYVLSTTEELKIEKAVVAKMEEFKRTHANETKKIKDEIERLKMENEDYQTSIKDLIGAVGKLALRRSTLYIPTQPKNVVFPSPPKGKPKQKKIEMDDELEEELQILITENTQ